MTDVVVIGSDPGALTAAIACRQAGLEVLVLEAADHLGGPAVARTGQLWLPAREGQDDDYATARDYFDRVVPDEPASAPRRHRLLTGTGPLADWLAQLGTELAVDRAADHYPHLPGGREAGRVLAPRPVDATVIGQLAEVVPDGVPLPAEHLVDRLDRGARAVGGAARGRRIVHGGAALVTGLLAACQRLQVNIWWDAPVAELVTSVASAETPERVTGVVVRRGDRLVRVLAGHAVLIAQGGFEASAPARRDYLPMPSRVDWTIGEARSDGVRQFEWAAELDLQLAGLGQAWWRGGLWSSTGEVWDAHEALCHPGGFVVDSTGRRFVDETAVGVDFARGLYARVRELGLGALPAWLIIGADHRRHCRLGPLAPGRVPRSAERDGFVVTARTLPELAWQIKVDAAGLQATADRFEQFAEAGVDADFGRSIGLGSLDRGPFHAVRVVPADHGTKGGFLTDEHARVLRTDGTPMPGLWAIGSAAASVSGAADPAPGFALAEAMVMGRAAAESISSQR